MSLFRLRDAAPRLWVVGDIMLDRYLIGSVDRVSPEAPVPVLLLADSQHRVGGAANVAQNIAALGGQVAVGGVIGADEPGERLLELLTAAGIKTAGLLRKPGAITTVKLRALAGAQQLLRIDHELRLELAATDIAAVLDGLSADVPDPALVVVSDYAKGVVSGELLAEIQKRTQAPIFVDPKGRDYARYVGAALITPNEREAALAASIDIHDDVSLRRAARRLAEIVPGADILVTRGPKGMTLLRGDGTTVEAPAKARRVFDVTGAGDTAIAALAVARACQVEWAEALHVANVAAGIAVGKIGAVSVYASELQSALSHEDFSVKVVSREGLAELRRTTALLGQRLVFTNGCFDLLHVGHLRLLQSARAMGDVLIVAANSDASVRRLKGPGRPVTPEHERAELLAALESVDFVTIFDEDTPLETILACRPDVLVKGADYSPDRIVGAPQVVGWGGRVATVPLVAGKSTSKIIAGMT